MKTQNLKISILATASALLLSACGATSAQTSGSTDLASRDTAKAVAACNIMTGPEISARLKAFGDNKGGYRFDMAFVKLTALATTFNNDAAYIKMFRWLASPNGYVYLDPNALSFYVYNPQTQTPVTGWVTSLRWSDVATAAQSMGHSNATSFFNSMQIVVNVADAAGEYDALQITNYDASTNKATSQSDALLPLFYASPADYAYETNGLNRAGVLKGMHPFASQHGNHSSSQYAQMAQSYCF